MRMIGVGKDILVAVLSVVFLMLVCEVIEPGPAFADAGAYSGWWYTSGQEGTGVSLEIQGTEAFGAWYVFSDSGDPRWYTFNGRLVDDMTITGDLKEWTGWPLGNPYAQPNSAKVGDVSVVFTASDQAVMTWSVGQSQGVKTMTKLMPDITVGINDPRDISGWYYDTAYDGMGWYLEARGDTLGLAWYHYGPNGAGRWYTALGEFPAGTDAFSAELTSWSGGQCVGCDPIAPSSAGVGAVSIQFSGLNATLSWNGMTYNLTRFRYGLPAQTFSHAERIGAFEGTKTCLSCHRAQAEEMRASVHYQWLGDASRAVNIASPLAGKLGGINDFCVYPDINWIGKLTNIYGDSVDSGCAQCHVGLGAKPTAAASQEQLENIDCLICHSDEYKRTVQNVNGTFLFAPDPLRMPVSLDEAARNVKLPSNGACLNCHTKAGGGNNFKRGDLGEPQRNPSRNFDVHLASAENGGAGLGCVDCHQTSAHRIAGRGSDLRPLDSPTPVNCQNCHTSTPHNDTDLDRHTARVNCTVCHIPLFSKTIPTDMNRDYSQPGDLVGATGLYEPHITKQAQVIPEYAFFNGTSTFYVFGSEAVPGANGRISMSAPVGSVTDPTSKIYAFKRHTGAQPIDPVTRRLYPLKIGLFFASNDLDSAVRSGAEAVGWAYNGYEFAQTERYMGLFHEVRPHEYALNCADCHNGGSRLNFAALGYTPKTTHSNGRPLCSACHEDESDEWSASVLFDRVHARHVDRQRLDCSECHIFNAASGG